MTRQPVCGRWAGVLLALTAWHAGHAACPAQELKPRATLDTGGRIVDGLAFSPDGKRLAAALRAPPPGWGQIVLGLVSSLSGVPPSTCTWTVKVWDLPGGKERASLERYSSALAFSPDGKTLALGGDGEVSLWDLSGPRPRQTGWLSYNLPWHSCVSSLAFSPDGKMLAAADHHAWVWDVAGKKQKATLKGRLDIHLVAFTPDGKTVLTGGKHWEIFKDSNIETEVRLWDAATAKEKQTLGPSRGKAVTEYLSFAPDGRTLMAVKVTTRGKKGDQEVVSWQVKLQDVTTHKERGRLQGKEDAGVAAAVVGGMFALTADARLLATGWTSPKAVALWDVPAKKALATLKGHSSEVYSLAFSPDGRWLASGGQEVKLWNLADVPKARK